MSPTSNSDCSGPVCGIQCSSCKEFLSAPIISLENCHHNVHKKCFEELSKTSSTCPLCDASFTLGTENPRLEALVVKLDRLANSILGKNFSSEPFLHKLLQEAIKEGEIDVVANVLAQGVSVNTLIAGLSPLYTACENGKFGIAQLLLENGADPTQKNDLSYHAKYDKYWHINDHEGHHGATPMKAAVAKGDKNLAQLLVRHGAPFDEPDSNGRSPVFIAVHSQQEELALFFIESGANVKAKDHHGISLACMAVRCGLLRVVEELIRRGIDVREQDEDGSTLLYGAAGRDHPQLLECLLKSGAGVVKDVLWLGKWTALSSAVEAGHLANVKLLVEAGADLTLSYHDKGRNILEVAENSLKKSVEFYSKNEKYQEEGNRVIEKERAVVEYLKGIISNSPSKMEVSPPLPRALPQEVILSDGEKVPSVLIKQTLMQIRGAIKGAGMGEIFLLVDLKDKANNEDDWMPAQNPFCNTIDIMKANLLIDGRGRMLRYVKSIVKECIVGEDFDTALVMPESFSKLY